MIVKCLIHIFVFLAQTVIMSSVNNYGQFTLVVSKVETCKGPKRKDCCVITVEMKNGVDMLYNIQILENVIPTKGKIIAMANNQPPLRLQMKKPCDHLFLGPLFRVILNVTQNCVFKKGNYSFNLNIEDVAQKYYGGMFLYGNMTFKSLFYTDDCNFSCTVVEVTISPKNNTSV